MLTSGQASRTTAIMFRASWNCSSVDRGCGQSFMGASSWGSQGPMPIMSMGLSRKKAMSPASMSRVWPGDADHDARAHLEPGRIQVPQGLAPGLQSLGGGMDAGEQPRVGGLDPEQVPVGARLAPPEIGRQRLLAQGEGDAQALGQEGADRGRPDAADQVLHPGGEPGVAPLPRLEHHRAVALVRAPPGGVQDLLLGQGVASRRWDCPARMPQ